jgi:hypothetical protein
MGVFSFSRLGAAPQAPGAQPSWFSLPGFGVAAGKACKEAAKPCGGAAGPTHSGRSPMLQRLRIYASAKLVQGFAGRIARV